MRSQNNDPEQTALEYARQELISAFLNNNLEDHLLNHIGCKCTLAAFEQTCTDPLHFEDALSKEFLKKIINSKNEKLQPLIKRLKSNLIKLSPEFLISLALEDIINTVELVYKDENKRKQPHHRDLLMSAIKISSSKKKHYSPEQIGKIIQLTLQAQKKNDSTDSLLNRTKLDGSQHDSYGDSYLHLAAQSSEKIASLILKNSDPRDLNNKSTILNLTPFEFALENKDISVTRLFLKQSGVELTQDILLKAMNQYVINGTFLNKEGLLKDLFDKRKAYQRDFLYHLGSNHNWHTPAFLLLVFGNIQLCEKYIDSSILNHSLDDSNYALMLINHWKFSVDKKPSKADYSKKLKFILTLLKNQLSQNNFDQSKGYDYLNTLRKYKQSLASELVSTDLSVTDLDFWAQHLELNSVYSGKNTLLHLAAQNSSETGACFLSSMIERLGLEAKEQDILILNKKNQNDHTFASILLSKKQHLDLFSQAVPNLDLSFRNSEGKNYLHLAVLSGDIQAVQSLINHSSNILCPSTLHYQLHTLLNQKDQYRNTPLHYALKQKSSSMANVLLDSEFRSLYYTDLSVLDSYKTTYLHLAIKKQFPDVVDKLVDNLIQDGLFASQLVSKNKNKDYLLLDALSGLNTSIVDSLLVKFEDYLIPQAFLIKDKDDKNLLHYLAKHKNLSDTALDALVKLACHYNPNRQSSYDLVNACDITGNTCIDLAIMNPSPKVCEALFNTDHNICITVYKADREGNTYLHNIAKQHNTRKNTRKFAQFILNTLKDSRTNKNNRGQTPLMLSLKSGNWELSSEFTSPDINFSTVDIAHNNYLHYAFIGLNNRNNLKQCDLKLITSLVDSSPESLNQQNSKQETPLSIGGNSSNSIQLKANLIDKHQNLIDFTKQRKFLHNLIKAKQIPVMAYNPGIITTESFLLQHILNLKNFSLKSALGSNDPYQENALMVSLTKNISNEYDTVVQQQLFKINPQAINNLYIQGKEKNSTFTLALLKNPNFAHWVVNNHSQHLSLSPKDEPMTLAHPNLYHLLLKNEGSLKILKILDREKTIFPQVDIPDNSGQTALTKALLGGNKEATYIFKGKGASPQKARWPLIKRTAWKIFTRTLTGAALSTAALVTLVAFNFMAPQTLALAGMVSAAGAGLGLTSAVFKVAPLWKNYFGLSFFSPPPQVPPAPQSQTFRQESGRRDTNAPTMRSSFSTEKSPKPKKISFIDV